MWRWSYNLEDWDATCAAGDNPLVQTSLSCLNTGQITVTAKNQPALFICHTDHFCSLRKGTHFNKHLSIVVFHLKKKKIKLSCFNPKLKMVLKISRWVYYVTSAVLNWGAGKTGAEMLLFQGFEAGRESWALYRNTADIGSVLKPG